jgi:hypothetical protein
VLAVAAYLATQAPVLHLSLVSTKMASEEPVPPPTRRLLPVDAQSKPEAETKPSRRLDEVYVKNRGPAYGLDALEFWRAGINGTDQVLQLVSPGLNMDSCYWNESTSTPRVVTLTRPIITPTFDPATNLTTNVTVLEPYNVTVYDIDYHKLVDYIAYADGGVKYLDPTGHGSKIAGGFVPTCTFVHVQLHLTDRLSAEW